MEEYDVMDRETGAYKGSVVLDRLSAEGAAKAHPKCVFAGTLSGEVIYAAR